MAITPYNSPNQNPTVLIDQMVGTAFPIVKDVSENIDFVKHVSTNLPALYSIFENVEPINAVSLKLVEIDGVYGGIAAVEGVYEDISSVVSVFNNLELIDELNTRVPSVLAASDHVDEVSTKFGDVDTAITAAQNAANISTNNANIVEEVLAEVQDVAEIAQTAIGSSLVVAAPSWTGDVTRSLVNLAPAFIGQRATVSDNDSGTHTGRTASDPSNNTTTGISNKGYYSGYSLTVGDWVWNGLNSSAGLASSADGKAGTSTTLSMTPKATKDTLDEKVPPDTTVSVLPSSSTYLRLWKDYNNRRLLGITLAGHLEARIADTSYVPIKALAQEIIDRLLIDGMVGTEIPIDSGWKRIFKTKDNHILGGWTNKDTFWAKLDDSITLPPAFMDALLVSQNLNPSRSIAMWGDSLTAGAGGAGTTMATVLASVLGRSVTNLGIGGQTSLQIATRQGGVPLTLTFDGNTINASGTTAITSRSTNILYNSGSYVGSTTGVVITDDLTEISGTISTDSSGNWTFTRTTAGVSKAASPDRQFKINQATTYEKHTIIIGIGRNGGYSSDTNVLVDQINGMVNRLTPYFKNYIVWGPPTGTGEVIGTSGYNNLKRVEDKLTLIYGSRFISLRKYLINYGLAESGLTATSSDTSDIAGDTIPRQLLDDGLHWTAAGYTVGGNALARKLVALGY